MANQYTGANAKPFNERPGYRGAAKGSQKPAFDYEEYLTKLADRKAADPEKYQRERDTRRREQRKWWDGYKEKNELAQANKEIFGAPVTRLERLQDIWAAILEARRSLEYWRLHLKQEDKIKIVKSQPRIRGCGRAANRADSAA